MNRIRATVVATLVAVWCFPMVSSAKAVSSQAESPAAMVTRAGTTGSSDATPSSDYSEAASLATREQQTRNLQDFRGGGVTIYIGSGVLLIVLIILLILLV
jgi:hypothetical protein